MGKNSYLLDSSLLVALFLDYDTFHNDASEIFDALRKQNSSFYVSHRVIEETSTVLTYKGSKEIGNKFLEYVFQTTDIIVIENNFFAEISFFQNHIQQSISFVDASLLYQAGTLHIQILSFDKQLLAIAKNL